MSKRWKFGTILRATAAYGYETRRIMYIGEADADRYCFEAIVINDTTGSAGWVYQGWFYDAFEQVDD